MINSIIYTKPPAYADDWCAGMADCRSRRIENAGSQSPKVPICICSALHKVRVGKRGRNFLLISNGERRNLLTIYSILIEVTSIRVHLSVGLCSTVVASDNPLFHRALASYR